MNVIEQARQAYAPTQGAVRSNRSVEIQLIGQITARMRQASAVLASPGGKAEFPKLVAALHDNQRMWTAMAADVADQGNALPADLRAQLFYLAEFTRQHSQKIIAGTADVSALIDINTAVMRGLNNQGAG